MVTHVSIPDRFGLRTSIRMTSGTACGRPPADRPCAGGAPSAELCSTVLPPIEKASLRLLGRRAHSMLVAIPGTGGRNALNLPMFAPANMQKGECVHDVVLAIRPSGPPKVLPFAHYGLCGSAAEVPDLRAHSNAGSCLFLRVRWARVRRRGWRRRLRRSDCWARPCSTSTSALSSLGMLCGVVRSASRSPAGY
jgi:hypothetical protein